jgi:DNA-directed RNA polymerase subunit RPC12/RpoP
MTAYRCQQCGKHFADYDDGEMRCGPVMPAGDRLAS